MAVWQWDGSKIDCVMGKNCLSIGEFTITGPDILINRGDWLGNSCGIEFRVSIFPVISVLLFVR